MKTPLSFLARLMARGRAEEKHPLPLSTVGPIEAPVAEDAAATSNSSTAAEPTIESEVAPVEVAQAAENDRNAEDTVVLDGVVAPKPAGEDLPLSVPEPAELEVKDHQVADREVDEPTLPLQSSPPERRARRAARLSKVSAEANANAPIVAEADPEADQAPPAVSEEEALDAEIASLRQQLAHKLRLQNAQLKEKLARFDRV